MTWADRLIARMTRRPPDFVIGGRDDPYLQRWWVIPRNPFFNVYLHQFLRSDDDRALHTHPWLFNVSKLLRGSYLEHTDDSPPAGYLRGGGDTVYRWGAAPHRVELRPDADGTGLTPAWTLFVTGPKVREWGFLCPQGFVHWKDFTDARDQGAVGRGCDQ